MAAEARARELQEELTGSYKERSRLAEEQVAASRQLQIVRDSNEAQVQPCMRACFYLFQFHSILKPLSRATCLRMHGQTILHMMQHTFCDERQRSMTGNIPKQARELDELAGKGRELRGRIKELTEALEREQAAAALVSAELQVEYPHTPSSP